MIWIGLPAYNEGSRIKYLLTEIDKNFKKEKDDYVIVVYDDGSSDDTVARVLAVCEQGIKAQLIIGGRNRGLGYALKSLILHFSMVSSLEDTIIIMDADATHGPGHIHRMLSYIQDGFDVVIASRYTPHSRVIGLKIYRQVLSLLASFIFKSLFPIKGVSDYTCAYRAYTAKILKLAREVYKDQLVEETGFACMAEVLIKLRKLDITACEVNLILRYNKKSGSSAMNVSATILDTFRLILRSLFLPNLPMEELHKLKEHLEL